MSTYTIYLSKTSTSAPQGLITGWKFDSIAIHALQRVFVVSMTPMSLLICSLLVLAQIWNVSSFLLPSRHVSRQSSSRVTSLGARVARKEEEQEKASEKDLVTIPFDGLVGRDQGSLFDKPLDVFDPIKDTDSLPGADGSDEKIAAIQARIRDRVAVLKKAGQWDDGGDVFGKDPLATQPIWQTMAMQVKICKPFDSTTELALTYVLLLMTTGFLMFYLIVLREAFDGFIIWFTTTDFDNDFLSGLFNQS